MSLIILFLGIIFITSKLKIVKYGVFLWDYFRVVAVDLFYGQGGNPKEFYNSLANGTRFKPFTTELTGNTSFSGVFRAFHF